MMFFILNESEDLNVNNQFGFRTFIIEIFHCQRFTDGKLGYEILEDCLFSQIGNIPKGLIF